MDEKEKRILKAEKRANEYYARLASIFQGNTKAKQHLQNIAKEVIALSNKNKKEPSVTVRKQNNKLRNCLLKDIRSILRIGKPKRIVGRIFVKRADGRVKVYPNWPAYRKLELQNKIKHQRYAIKHTKQSKTRPANRS
jgi:hypothetical protein